MVYSMNFFRFCCNFRSDRNCQMLDFGQNPIVYLDFFFTYE